MNIIPSLERAALADLADAVLLGDIVTVRRAKVRSGRAWAIDPREPGRPVLYLAYDATPAEIARYLPGAFAVLRRLADERVRPTLRAVPGAAESLSAPVRPTLRVLPGGAR